MRRSALTIVAALAAAIPAVVPQVAQAAVPIQLCTVNNQYSLCLNRGGGGTGPGTWVVGWSADGNNNNDFEYGFLTGMCGGGRVIVYAGGGCPFTPGSGLNARFDGAYIVDLYAYNENECVGTTGMGNAILTACPDRNGNGGANGTIDVILNDTNNPTPIINRYWSNYFGQNHYICSSPPRGQQINLNNIVLSGYPPQCEWNEV
jgi:hypothetical protein